MVVFIPFLIFLSPLFPRRTVSKASRTVWRVYRKFKKYPAPDFDTIHSILMEDIPYYQHLSEEGKEKFRVRTRDFIRDKEFIGKDGLEITDRIKVNAAAPAIQLTFGLKVYMLSHYLVIMIHPSSFFYKDSHQRMKGGTLPNGTLIFSWEDLRKGYQIPDDKYNLGLHEMAHAMKIDLEVSSSFDEHFGSYFDNWVKVGSEEFKKLRKGTRSFLDDYGGRNVHEFFAVCVEHFFEAPEEFSEKLPEIFDHLVHLLNQDPRNVNEDYHIPDHYFEERKKAGITRETPSQAFKTGRHKSWHWSLTIFMISLFLASWIDAFFMSLTLVPLSAYWFIVGVLAAINWAIQYKKVVRLEIMNKVQFLFYVVFGAAPISLLLLFLLNFFVVIEEQTWELEVERAKPSKNQGTVIVVTPEAKHFNQALSIEHEIPRSPNNVIPKEIHIHVDRGVLGVWMIKGKERIYPAGKTP